MKAKLALVVTTILLTASLTAPAVALAGGDQVHRPDDTPQYQADGDYPLEWRFGK